VYAYECKERYRILSMNGGALITNVTVHIENFVFVYAPVGSASFGILRVGLLLTVELGDGDNADA
jgi:hypothetical protein